MSGARKAIEALGAAGITHKALAAELGVRPETVRRWSIGRHAPNARNGLALRQLVDRLLASALAGDSIADARQGAHLQRAKAALEPTPTPQERQDLALLKASIIASMEAAKRGEYRSITRDADPFALCRADSDMADAIDLAFAA